MQEWNRNLFDITLLLVNDDPQDKWKYELPQNTKIIVLNKSKKMALLSLVKTIRQLDPDIVFSTLAPINILCLLCKILLRSKKTKYIIRETTIKSISIKNTKTNPIERWLYKTLIKIFYNFADAIIALSEGAKKDLMAHFGVKEAKIRVIYNPLDIQDIQLRSQEPVEDMKLDDGKRKIICVGALVKSKGHHYLIEALEILNLSKHDEIDAYFIGEGKLKAELESEVKKRKLEAHIHFLGFKENPYKYVKHSDVFVLPALWEGFGNVIVEAMACGIPVIATRCESGPKEIINNGMYGSLCDVGDSKDLALKIQELLESTQQYELLSNNAPLRAKDFDIHIIIQQYENHVLSLLT